MRWALQRTAAPTLEPVALDLAKWHLHVTFNDDDQLIGFLIQVAREIVEMETGLCLYTQSWQQVMDRFPNLNRQEYWPEQGYPQGAIMLQRWPVQSITSIVWNGQDGSTNTVSSADYSADLTGRPARVTPNYNKFWPAMGSVALVPQAGVQVNFTAGYTSPSLCPALARHCILLLLGHLYMNRESVVLDNRIAAIQVPDTAQRMLDLLRLPQVA